MALLTDPKTLIGLEDAVHRSVRLNSVLHLPHYITIQTLGVLNNGTNSTIQLQLVMPHSRNNLTSFRFYVKTLKNV